MSAVLTATLSQIVEAAPLVAAWSVTTFAITTLLTGVATLLHRVAHGTVPYRLVWSVALLTAFGVTITQPWRRTATMPSLAVSALTSLPAAVTIETATPMWRTAVTAFGGTVRAADDALASLSSRAATATRRLPLAARVALVLLWPVCTLVLVLVGAWSYWRQRAILRGATCVESHGCTLYVTAQSGPAVYGVRHPRIIVPLWFTQRTSEEQRLVVAHEQAHIDAHDPALLLSACVLTALVPWNPCAWYLLNRLRLAIELDCDARVLRAGATPRHYGALLIELSAAAAPAPLLTGATAFSHHASHLERRLRRMTDRPTTHTVVRRAASLSIALLAIAAACGAELPTSAELQGLDVASAEKRAFVATPNMTAASYVVDGKTVTEQEAKAIGAERIASIEIEKQDKKRSVVRIKTQAAGAKVAATGDSTAPKRITVALRPTGTADSSRTLVMGDSITLTPAKRTFEGLIFIDGAKATEDEMKKLSPATIERIEVIKGAAGEKLYGPDGAKGVIVVTTKK